MPLPSGRVDDKSGRVFARCFLQGVLIGTCREEGCDHGKEGCVNLALRQWCCQKWLRRIRDV